MNYDALLEARKYAGWTFLASGNAPMVASFLHKIFLKIRRSGVPHEEMLQALSSHLNYINSDNDAIYAQSAEKYLMDWTENEWLRRYFDDDDQEVYDLTAPVEIAINWILSTLSRKDNIGTESRMITLMNLMRQVVVESDSNPERRLKDLYDRRDAINSEIDTINAGVLNVMNEARQVDFFQSFSDTSRALLADFRGVAHNFRMLDRETRMKISSWIGAKGDLILNILNEDADIERSEQGRSFSAFFRLLRSESRMGEFERLLKDLLDIPAIKALPDHEQIGNLKLDLIEAGRAVHRIKSDINRQLNAQLNTKARSENKRITQLVDEMVAASVLMHEKPKDKELILHMDELLPKLQIPMNRNMYTPPIARIYNSDDIQDGTAHAIPDSLFDSITVNQKRLTENISSMLLRRPQVTLMDVSLEFPIKQGLIEVLGYLKYTNSDLGFDVVFDESSIDEITWGSGAEVRKARMPRMIFKRQVK